MTLADAINPATRDYLERGLRHAEESAAELVIIELDTPGGQVESMRRLGQAILAADVPVVTWVTPAGARAASAGTYLLYASHVAAMTPGTHLGSATPVSLTGDDGESEQANAGAMRRKVVEDAVAQIRGYAEHHGRNAAWAEEAVREAANLSAEEALSRDVIDLVAADRDDLLGQLDGRTVQMASGERQLSTQALSLTREPAGWRTALLSLIADPVIAYGLLLIGIYGLIFELASPGTLFPGVIGGISLLLGLFAFQVLSIDLAGLGLVLLGLAMIVGEAFLPSFGVLGVGGIAAFIFGSILLMDEANSALAWPLVGGTALVAAGFLLWCVLRLVSVRRRLPKTGREEMVGAEARALGDFRHGRGKVMLHGERWQARAVEVAGSGAPIVPVQELEIRDRQRLRVLAVHGLTVDVAVYAETETLESDLSRRVNPRVDDDTGG